MVAGGLGTAVGVGIAGIALGLITSSDFLRYSPCDSTSLLVIAQGVLVTVPLVVVVLVVEPRPFRKFNFRAPEIGCRVRSSAIALPNQSGHFTTFRHGAMVLNQTTIWQILPSDWMCTLVYTPRSSQSLSGFLPPSGSGASEAGTDMLCSSTRTRAGRSRQRSSGAATTGPGSSS